MAHSRAGIIRKDSKPQNKIKLPSNMRQFVLLPTIARKQYKVLLKNQEFFEKESENANFNQYIEGKNKSLGIIACGIAYNYVLENYSDRNVPYPVLKLSQYPLPRNMVEKIFSNCEEILVLEDGYPIIEELLKGFIFKGKNVKGRLDGTIPRDGELNPNIVGNALGFPDTKGAPIPEIVANRPPSLCNGCPHTDSFLCLNEALAEYPKGNVFSDIGCYTLSALPPLESVNSCVDMGASITMAKGAADAGLFPSVAVIGDSTFTHSGITGLLDAVNDKSPITVIILDNATTAMTGGQTSSATGKIKDICKGLGVEENHIRIIKPLHKNHIENTAIMKEELLYKGVSVIIPYRECIQTLNKRMREKFKNKERIIAKQ